MSSSFRRYLNSYCPWFIVPSEQMPGEGGRVREFRKIFLGIGSRHFQNFRVVFGYQKRMTSDLHMTDDQGSEKSNLAAS